MTNSGRLCSLNVNLKQVFPLFNLQYAFVVVGCRHCMVLRLS